MQNYYRELNNVQRKINYIDIVSITGFMTKEEKLAHLERYALEVGYKINLK